MSSTTAETPTRRPRLRALLAAVVTAALVTTGTLLAAPSAEAAPTGFTNSLGGHVNIATNAGGGLRSAQAGEVQVSAYRETSSGEVQQEGLVASTDGSGRFTVGQLPIGTYVFHYSYAGTDGSVVSSWTTPEGDPRHHTAAEALADGAGIALAQDRSADIPTHLLRNGVILDGTVENVAGHPLEGQNVTLLRYTWEPGPGGIPSYFFEDYLTTTTDASGYFNTFVPGGLYAIKSGGAGGYRAEVSPDQYADLGSPDGATWFSAVMSYPTAASVPVTREVVLDGSGRISGTVKTTSGSVIPGIVVTPYSVDPGSGEYVPFAEITATTGSKGTYTLTGLPAGTWKVGFSSAATATTQYADEFWSNKTTLDAASVITLAAGAAKTGINGSLAKAASFSGTITFSGGGVPDDDDVFIAACAYSSGSHGCTPADVDDASVGDVRFDDATGRYTVTGIPSGSYVLYVDYRGVDNFQPEWSGGAHRAAAAVPIAVASGASVTGKNIVLDPGASISGQVLMEGGASVGSAVVEVYSAETDDFEAGAYLTATVTDSFGSYTVTGLNPGDYFVRVGYNPAAAAYEWYGGDAYTIRDAEVVTTSGTGAVTGIDFSLVTGGRIAGEVRGVDTGTTGLPGVELALESITLGETSFATTQADASGAYEFTNLPPGSYRLYAEQTFAAEGGVPHAPGYYNSGVPSAPKELAQEFAVSPGTNGNVDVVLSVAGYYTGRIVDAVSGNPVENAQVTAGGAFDYSDENGQFRLDGVEAGTHRIAIEGPAGYADLTEKEVAEMQTGGVDLGSLAIEASTGISGQITGSDGKPLRDVFVVPLVYNDLGYLVPALASNSTVTNAQGIYYLDGLPQDDVYLYFIPPTTKYPVQFLGGGSDVSFARPVSLTFPYEQQLVDVRLTTGGTLNGVVKDRVSGKPVAGIPVVIQTVDGTDFDTYGFVLTNSKGAYSVSGLEPGSYRVTVNGGDETPSGPRYGESVTTVLLGERATKTVNASITPSQRVTGVAKDAAGNPVKGVDVRALRMPSGSGVEFTTTTSSTGSYSLLLPPGSYRLQFSDPTGQLQTTFSGGAGTLGGATPVTVGSKAVSGRNVTMTAVTGGISVDSIFGYLSGDGDYEVNLYGTVLLELLDGPGGDVQSRQPIRADLGVDRLWKFFPVFGLRDGWYRVTFTAYSEGGTYGGLYPEVVRELQVSGGAIASLGDVDLGEPELFTTDDFPEPSGGSPTVVTDGSPTVGETVTVDEGPWNRDIDSFEYRWLRNGVPIHGATGDEYLLRPGDATEKISVEVIASVDGLVGDYLGGAGAARSAAIVPGLHAAPVYANDGSHYVSGTPAVGKTLTAQPGTYDVTGLNFRYQWFRAGVPISGANSATYKVTTADVGSVLGYTVEASRPGYLVYDSPRIDATSAAVPAIALKQTKAGKVSLSGEVFSVTTGTWTPSTDVAYTYEWREWTDDGDTYVVEGTTSSLAKSALHPSRRAEVAVTASKPGYVSTTVVLPVQTGAAPVFTAGPQLAGTLTGVGFPLSVDLTDAETQPLDLPGTGADVVYAYQWYRNGTKMTGATTSTYTPVAADAGKNLEVRITLSAKGYAASTLPAWILYAGTVAGPSTITAGTPTIVGDGWIGRPLSVDPGTWSPSVTFSYQWKRNGAKISGATKSTYTPTAADDGDSITVVVTGSAPSYPATPGQSSNPITPQPHPLVSATAPTIPTVVKVGSKVAAGVGGWDLKPSTYTYQWYLNDVAIQGATSSTYTPTVTDLADDLSVRVVAKRSGYPDSSATSSNRVTIVAGAAVKPTKAPSIQVNDKTVTTVKDGNTVVAVPGLWPAGAYDFEYQWQYSPDKGVTWLDYPGFENYAILIDVAGCGDPATCEFPPPSARPDHRLRLEITAIRTGYEPSVGYSAPFRIVN